jgi:Uma2 family endonuclease
VLLVENTSPSTEAYDRGEKVRHYQLLPTLREIVIVSHHKRELTLHRRVDDGWSVTTFAAGTEADLVSVGVRLRVDDVYRDGLEDAV